MSTGYNLKTTKLLNCALIGVCAVIRSTTVYKKKLKLSIQLPAGVSENAG